MSKSEKAPTKVFGITIGGPKKEKGAGTVLTPEEKASHVYTPSIPIVNVIPNSVFEKYQVKGIVRKLIGVGAVVALILAGGYAGGTFLLTQQANELSDISTELSKVTEESTSLTPYQAYQMSVDEKRKTLNSATATDVNMGNIYSIILDSASINGIELTNLQVEQYADPGSAGSSCINPDPFGKNVSAETIIGCITLGGNAPNKDAVNAFFSYIEDFGGVNGELYRDAFISSFSYSPDGEAAGYSFKGSISFTSALYTGKYKELAVALNELMGKKSVDVTESDKSNDPNTPDVPIVLPDAGPASTHIKESIPTLTAEDGRIIDSMAYTACKVEPVNVDNLEVTLKGFIEGSYPDADVATIVADALSYIPLNCNLIKEAEEKN